MPSRLVIVGAGMASGRALEDILARAPGAYDITLFGAEPRGAYSRVLLSQVLAGEKTGDQIVIHDAAWYAAHGVTCRFGEPVVAIDRVRKMVVTEKGETPYDRLLLATGSRPLEGPSGAGRLGGVTTFRDLDDVAAMVAAARPGARAAVIGGGPLGLEAAAGLRQRGMDVTVLHLAPRLMNRHVDDAAGALLGRALEARGIRIRCGARTREIFGDGAVKGVRLEDGAVVPADLVCIALGVRPEAALAGESGLPVGRGLRVDDDMRTADPSILGVGECVEHRGRCYGLVAPAYEMARAAAATLAGERAPFPGALPATRLKIAGLALFSAGDISPGPGREEIAFRDLGRGVYKRLVIEDGRLVGVVLFGDTADANWFYGLMRDGDDISQIRDTLTFGPAFAEPRRGVSLVRASTPADRAARPRPAPERAAPGPAA